MAFILVSCRPAEPQAKPETIDRVGLVLLSQGAEAIPSGQAAFVELVVGRAEELLANPFGDKVGTCQVDAIKAAVAGDVIDAPSGARLNASEIELRTADGAFATLKRGAEGRHDLVGATEPLPASLTLRQPASAAFPSFTTTVNTGAKPRLASGFSPDGITAETAFGWLPGHAGAVIVLVGSGGGVSFSCVVDDAAGRFSFPAETRAELARAGFSAGTLRSIGRVTTTQARSGSAVLLVTALRTTDLGAQQ